MARFRIEDLTGEQYDEVELLLGAEVTNETPLRKLARAVGYVRTKAVDPSVKYDEYNKLTVAQQITDSGLVDSEDDEAGKGKTS